MTCPTCGKTIDPLAVFPGGLCVDCYALTPEGRRPVTADELAGMWGGGARKARGWGRVRGGVFGTLNEPPS